MQELRTRRAPPSADPASATRAGTRRAATARSSSRPARRHRAGRSGRSASRPPARSPTAAMRPTPAGPGHPAGQDLDGPVEPLKGPVAPERDERVEQRRRRGPAGHRDADRHEQVADLPAAVLGERAERRLELVGLERDRADVGDGVVGRRRAPRCVVAASQRFGTSSAGSMASSSTHRKPTRSPIAPSRGSRSVIIGQERAQLLVGRHPVDPAGREIGFDERPQPVDEVVRLEPTDPLAVEPLEPLAVEDGAALVDVVELEALDDLVDRQDLLLGAGRPAEQREVVDQRLADEALGDVVGHRGLALALAHLRPVGIEDERQVGECGHRHSRARGTAGCASACSTGGPRRG